MVKKINFLLLPLLLCMGTLSFANHLNLNSNPAENAGMDCPYQTPTNFDAIEIGTTFVKMGWIQPGAIPPFYNMKAFEVATNNLVYNVTFPNVSTNHRINGLAPNTWYRFELTPLAANLNNCTPPAIALVKTGIIDLIVAKNSLPNSNIPDCTINVVYDAMNPNNPGSFCNFPSNGDIAYFKIVKGGNQNDSRVFSLNKNTNTQRYELNIDNHQPNNLGQYSFGCPQAPPNMGCNANNINIKDNDVPNQTIAELTVIGVASNIVPSKLICNKLLPNYTITQLDLQGLGNIDPISLREEELTILSEQPLSVSPNPFSNRLEINIPYATEENDVKIQLFDLHGRLVMSQVTAGGLQIRSLDTEVLQPGIYLLRVETGERAETVKVIKTQ